MLGPTVRNLTDLVFAQRTVVVSNSDDEDGEARKTSISISYHGVSDELVR